MSWFKKRAPEFDERNQTHTYRPMGVIRTDEGSIEPPFDGSWDDATKLQWYAGVLKEETGFSVTVYQPASSRDGKVDWSAFGLSSPTGGSLASITVDEFWLFAVGVRWAVDWATANARR